MITGGGICDADYIVRKGSWICPYYQLWSSMFFRCYSKARKKTTGAYADCSVCDEWFKFSSFKNWVLTQKQHTEWLKGDINFDLDKDILCRDNKIYSPDTCVLVPHNINLLFTKRMGGEHLKGVWFDEKRSKFCIKSSLTGKRKTLRFDCEVDAHNTWKSIRAATLQQSLDDYKSTLISDDRVVSIIEKKIQCLKSDHPGGL